jgi:hypothetical protein
LENEVQLIHCCINRRMISICVNLFVHSSLHCENVCESNHDTAFLKMCRLGTIELEARVRTR